MLRIVAGQYRGRKLYSSADPALRPTSDRVKETIFNVLQQEVSGARVLDLYAGTGNLGLEAWSRGASSVTWVERSRRLIRLIERNTELLRVRETAAAGEREFAIVQADAVSFLAGQSRRWDVILADPPYADAQEPVLLSRTAACLVETGCFVLQHGKQWALPEDLAGWEIQTQKYFGNTAVDFLRRSEAAK